MSTGAPEMLGAAVEAVAEDEASSGPVDGSLVWRRLRRNRIAMLSLGFLVGLCLLAIFAPLVVHVVGARPPLTQSTTYQKDTGLPTGISRHALFGADDLGRDVFSRTVYGSRVSLEVAGISTALIILIGLAIGLPAGYYGGWIDSLLSRFTDIVLAFPLLLLALGIGAACLGQRGCLPANPAHIGWTLLALAGLGAIAAVALLPIRRRALERRAVIGRVIPFAALAVIGLAVLILAPNRSSALIQPGTSDVVFVIVLTSWPYAARVVRGQTLVLRNQQFVEAARVVGASDGRILWREILPNLVTPLIVTTTITVPTVILTEAALSFLGVGIQPPTPSWGNMINDATGVFQDAWWFMALPGIALLFTVLSATLFGDRLQDALRGGREA